MGYSAQLHRSDGPVVIPADRIEAVLAELAVAQDRPSRSSIERTHLSWCLRVETYGVTALGEVVDVCTPDERAKVMHLIELLSH